jgi:O-antigen/teichoic acid export membrane protein
MALGPQLRRLGKHSLIYGLGGLVSRVLAVFLLPLYTRYLSPSDYGVVETLIALTTVVGIALSAGIGSAFFRFYFDSNDPAARRRVLRTSFWFIMGMATLGLVVGVAFSSEISQLLFGTTKDAKLVAASFVGLWAGMNWTQLTNLFRVEERSVAFVSASVANILVTVGATLILVVALDEGPIGVIVGNFTGTLAVYCVLVFYRREQLGLEFDRKLLREMNRFGLPLVPSALFLWVTNFSDRIFLVKLADTHEVGLYSVGVRIASAMVLMLTAFRLAWPAFAYSIEDDREARRTYGFVLTYLVLVATWMATTLALLSPWIVKWITAPAFESASRVVGPLAFSAVAFGGYIVVAIGVGRARRTQFNWVVTGAAAIVNIALNLTLIPPYGMMGAAIATIAAYTTMFVGMSWWSQRIYRVPYQWRRVTTAIGTGLLVVAIGKFAEANLAVSALLALAYPLALLPLGFYMPSERRAIGARLRLAR